MAPVLISAVQIGRGVLTSTSQNGSRGFDPGTPEGESGFGILERAAYGRYLN